MQDQFNITEEQWQLIDKDLFAQNPFRACTEILTLGKPSLSLRDAQDILGERYRKLRAEHPEHFACDEANYWNDWYS